MGISNTAVLVFGVDLGEELPEFLEDFGSDFDEYLDSLSGLPNYGEEGHDFSAQREFREKQIVDLVMYCSYDYPMYILALRGTEINGFRGNGKTIDPTNDFNIDPARLEEFKSWLAEHEIEGEPKWYLDTING